MSTQSPADSTNWWSQPCGTRDVLQIALPLVVSTLAFTFMQFCDRMFLAWHSTDELAAVLPVGILNWTLISFPFGLASYATTFVAKYYGAKQYDRIGPVVWQAVWIGTATIPMFIVVACLAPMLFLAAGHDAELARVEAIYLQALAMGSAGTVLTAGLETYYVGQGRTLQIMLVNIAAAALNVLLDWMMIFGNFGLPEMGIMGAGIATSISMFSKVVVYAAMIYFSGRAVRHGIVSGWRLNWHIMLRLFRFGLPSGFQLFVEGIAITIFSLVMGQLSKEASAACSVAFSINMVAFIPVVGMGMAVSTLVGQQIGRGNPDLAARATWHGAAIGMVYTLVFAVIYVAFPDMIVQIFASDAPNFSTIEELSILMLRFVAVFCLFDTAQIIFVSAIKGAGDTMFVVGNTLVTSVVFVVIGYWGAPYFTGQRELVTWWWLAFTGWLVVLAIAYFLRFLQGKWRKMTVIDK